MAELRHTEALGTQSSALLTNMPSVLELTFVFNGFIEMQFTCHKIHPFKVDKSMAFRLFTAIALI